MNSDVNRTAFGETYFKPLRRPLLYNLPNKRYALLANLDNLGSRILNF